MFKLLVLRVVMLMVISAACAGCKLNFSGLGDSRSAQECRVGTFRLEGQFPGARLGKCRVVSDSEVVLTNHPEDQPPINHSPWYAFRVTEGQGSLQVRIDYAVHVHRYHPKISIDGIRWQRLDDERIRRLDGGRSVVFDLEIDRTPLWIAGQEVLDNAWYESWYDSLEGTFAKRVIGESFGGRSIVALENDTKAEHMVLLLGRAHPPEVTGAIGMQAFVNRLVSEHSEFLQEYRVLVVPQLNPDGVALGYWRHGLGGVDLNRDWGPFTQPATQAVRRFLDGYVTAGLQMVVMLDFHSTQRNLFYTQSEEEESLTDGFVTQWLALAASRGVYPFEQQRRHNRGQPTSKNYFYERFGIPAITYEVGDETPREDIVNAAYVFADTFVETLSQKTLGRKN